MGHGLNAGAHRRGRDVSVHGFGAVAGAGAHEGHVGYVRSAPGRVGQCGMGWGHIHKGRGTCGKGRLHVWGAGDSVCGCGTWLMHGVHQMGWVASGEGTVHLGRVRCIRQGCGTSLEVQPIAVGPGIHSETLECDLYAWGWLGVCWLAGHTDGAPCLSGC